MNELVNGFIEAMFFADVSQSDFADIDGRDGSIPADFDHSHIDSESMAKIEAICSDFESRAGDLLDGLDLGRVGNDIYFTRAGHGVGGHP